LLDTRADNKINRAEDDRSDYGERRERKGKSSSKIKTGPVRPLRDHPEVELIRYKLDVGYEDRVTPGQLVGAIANTADISSEYIGQIEIYDNVSTVDLPEGMPKALFKLLERTRVGNKPLKLRPLGSEEDNQAPYKAKRKKSNQRPDRKGSAQPRKRQSND